MNSKFYIKFDNNFGNVYNDVMNLKKHKLRLFFEFG